MGRQYAEITEELKAFIERQPLFFVATAPLSGTGLVNLSPKGMHACVVLDAHRVSYVDLTGSGVETIAHLKENGRIVLMFCAFDGAAKIVRLHGTGRVIEPGDSDYAAAAAAGRFPSHPGVRAIIVVTVSRVGDSCGFGVPIMRVDGNRNELNAWAEAQGAEGMEAYRQRKNRVSLDGLPAVRER